MWTGAFAQAFLYPAWVTRERRQRMGRGQRVVPGVAYIIRSGRLEPEWAATERRAMSVAGRATAIVIAASGHNDVMGMCNTTLHDGIDFNFAYMGRTFP
jgi:hypothetical protein